MGYYANQAAVQLAGKAFRKWHDLAPLCMGAAAFGVSQLLLRLPILQHVLPQFDWFLMLPYTRPVFYGLFLAVTAGLFEETARWIGYRILGKRYRGFRDGIVFGLGHGGLEALWVFWMIGKQVLAGAAVSPLNLAVALLERLGAVSFHVGASVMVLLGVRQKKIRWLFLAVALHTLLDLCAVLVNSVWISEGIALAAGAGMLLWAFRRKRTFAVSD